VTLEAASVVHEDGTLYFSCCDKAPDVSNVRERKVTTTRDSEG
jgi:hypothetical protein